MYYYLQQRRESGLGALDLSAVVGRFSVQTILLVLGLGIVGYWLLTGEPAKRRRGKLREAKEEYKAKRREIKRTYKRWGIKKRKHSSLVAERPRLTDTERDVIAGLQGQGAKFPAAVKAVKEASAELGDVGFDGLFRAAVAKLRKVA